MTARPRGRGATPRPMPSRDADKLLTTCSACRRGVFAGQGWRWSVLPLGIVHAACPPPKEAP